MVNLDGQKVLLLLIFIFAYSVTIYIYANRPSPVAIKPVPIGTLSTLPPVQKINHILVLYVWADTDVQCLGNLEFFVRHGVRATQPVDYYFILQQVNNKPVDESRLPLLPSNARYIQHENKCMDIGTMGWFFSQNITNTTSYKYFFFMNASIRGPFFPPYFEALGIQWFDIFISRLTDEIKLVGASINCEQRPHVQSYIMVTDRVGFAVLTGNESGIFRCHANYRDAVFDGEIAASQLLLRFNYQIASLQSKYQGWDFRKPENGGCNYGASPIYRDKAIDEINHDPFELVFVKFKGNPPFDTEIERRALVYKKWLDERPRPPVKNSTNATNTTNTTNTTNIG
jgi:hypothetical protein